MSLHGSSKVLAFGNFHFRLGSGELLRLDEDNSSSLIPIGARAASLLAVLVERQGEVISKDDLMDLVWHRQAVTDANLTVQISELRRALDRGREQGSCIQTVHGRGYRFVVPVTTLVADANLGPSVPSSTPTADLMLPDLPSIAVLPFTNLSGDREQEYFADGVVEDIITALSRFSQLFVIARNSSFTYKGRTVDVKQVGRELGVRYVLEGSVRKAGNRVRISGQLIDAFTGAHLWADRFEGALGDIFDLQDQVTTSVVGAIAPKLEQAETERAKRKPTANLDAYDFFLRGTAKVYQWTREANDEALRLFYRAIELDPDFAAPNAFATWCYCWRKHCGWVTNREQEIAETARLARRAVQLGKDDALALCWAGYSLACVVRELDEGIALIDRALVLNPNLARAWNLSGWVRIWLGQPEIAIEHLARAMRLSPLDPAFHAAQIATAHAHFFAGRYDEASSWAEKALREQPNFSHGWHMAAASHAFAGRLEQAQKALARLRQLEPGLLVSNLRDELGPYRRPEDVARYENGLRKAGLPE